MKDGYKITVVGTGYVGMSMAVLLAQHNEVTALDIDAVRTDLINQGKSTVVDVEIEQYLKKETIVISDIDRAEAYKNPDFVVVATPTDYDPETNYFDTSSVEAVIGDVLAHNETSMIVIKSTVPVGFTRSMKDMFKTERIIFSPEFLREGQALKDNLHPSRIIMGSDLEQAHIFASLLRDAAEKPDIETLFMSSTEAEAVKLFANTYLAMRVSFFNELDSYALGEELDTRSIIDGVSLIRVLATTIIIRALVMAAIAFRKTQSNCSPIMTVCPKTLFRRLSPQMRHARILWRRKLSTASRRQLVFTGWP